MERPVRVIVEVVTKVTASCSAWRTIAAAAILASLSLPLAAQSRSVWVLRASGEMVEYDAATFTAKQTVKVPAEVLQSPANMQVNRLGQILFAPTVNLPLSEEDVSQAHKVWLWDGHAATTFDLGVLHKKESTGSNQAVIESAPQVYLAADGTHLFWFANQTRRLQREGVDLSSVVTWQAWRTNLNGTGREELASEKLPECKCKIGTCEDSCPAAAVWTPQAGLADFFLTTQTVSGQAGTTYGASEIYRSSPEKWNAAPFTDSLQRVLDASSDAKVILSAIPDTGCCGWSNQSDDQAIVWRNGAKLSVFDERETYKNPDYDASFFPSNAQLSPGLGYVAMTIAATAQADEPIQLAEEGEANPEESKQIRKALAELPAVVVKTIADVPKQLASAPHAELAGWISEKEILIVEDHALVVLNPATGAKRKLGVKVEDAEHVWIR
jgi:hypothetical protein